MSRFRLRLSERSQVALIVFLALSGLFAIWYFLLLPQQSMADENDALRSQLDHSPYAHKSPAHLLKALEQEQASAAILEQEWSQTAERLATFANQAALRRSPFGRIDYKNELFLTRKSLVDKSDKLEIQLIPTDLGSDDMLKDKDDVRVRMLQLKAVEKLADLTLDGGIERLIAIAPLPPVVHKSPDGKFCFDEYPVRAEFDVAFEKLYTLFQTVFEEDRVFAFRNIRIASGPERGAPVRVSAVMSALVFE